VGSIGRRVRRLEEVCRLSSGNDNPVEREKRRAAFVETFERAWERAEREEAVGFCPGAGEPWSNSSNL
jgi:hypothetical protein